MLTYADEILYGGAAGGGKSAWIRAEAVRMALSVPGSRTLILRRTFPELEEDMIPAFLEEIPQRVATYNISKHRWTFINGSVIVLGHMQTEKSVTKYQGSQWQLVCFDELTHFVESQYRYLKSRLRVAGPVKERMEALGLRPRMIASANPGSVGHAWVKARFVDPAPATSLFTVVDQGDTGDRSMSTRCFIPARVADNPHVNAEYRQTLNDLDDDTRRALRDGDWDSYEGQRFKEWRNDIHVITPEQAAKLMPAVGGIRAIGVDYGMDAPFSAHWLWLGPDRLVIVYREVYKAGLTPKEQAKLIAASERDGERGPGRAIPLALDPSMWARNANLPGAKPTGDRPPPGSLAYPYSATFGSAVVKARNDRLAGVALIADKLKVRRDGMPRLLVVDTCRNLIRTLPALVRDPRNPEDVDTHTEDHAYDSLRYGLMEIDGRHRSRDSRGRQAGANGHLVHTGPGSGFRA